MATKKTAAKTSKGTTKKSYTLTPDKAYRVARIHKSAKTASVDALPSEYVRADIEFIGVDHSGASFEARVFVNNPNASAETQLIMGNGYAGSFYVFGHGGCFGDVGHCDIHPHRDEFDPRRSHPLEPIKKVVVATDVIKAASAGASTINITVVPVVTSWTEQVDDTQDVLHFDHINLVTYY
jgi:tyrosinase